MKEETKNTRTMINHVNNVGFGCDRIRLAKTNHYTICANSGITLVALIITIIILIILAGVTLNITLGENGILRKSKEAVEGYTKAEIIEQIRLDIAAKEMENNGSITDTQLNEILENYGTISEDGTILTTNERGHEIEITEIWNGDIIIENSLASQVKVGDYVNYIPRSNETYTSVKGQYEPNMSNDDKRLTTINIEGEPTGTGTSGNGHSEQTYTVPSNTDNIKWRVLSIENGCVNLVSEKEIGKLGLWDGTSEDMFQIEGITGYAYYIKELNMICSIYGTGDGAKLARSIDIEDINKITGYDVTKDNSYSSEYGKINGWVDDYKWRYTGYSYRYNNEGLNTVDTNSIEYKLIFNGMTYFIASRCIYSSNSDAEFDYRFVNGSDRLTATTIMTADDSGFTSVDGGEEKPIRPVVTLKANVKAGTSIQNSDGTTTWNIEF